MEKKGGSMKFYGNVVAHDEVDTAILKLLMEKFLTL